MPQYDTSKAAVAGLTRSMARDHAVDGAQPPTHTHRVGGVALLMSRTQVTHTVTHAGAAPRG